MATILTHLDDQLRHAFEGPAWHGPSVREALGGVTADGAMQHPIPGAHSIWELVLHLAGSYRLVLRRLDGDGSPLLPHEDWPPVPEPTESAWQKDLASLQALNAAIRAAVIRYPMERLFDPIVPESPYAAFTQFIGLTQHDLYHAGQIMLLKRGLTNRIPAL